jgi:two-component system, NtrC family, sensor kinase
MKTSAHILVIDDEPGIRELLSQELDTEGYKVETASDGEEGVKKIRPGEFQVVLCDLNMPKLGGLQALENIRKQDPDIEVIVMTGFATVETAVAAMKKGAYDFIQKPFRLDELFSLVEKSLEKSELRRTVLELQATKRKLEQMQAQLIQSEKLAGVGQLAAGIAHELNNPLSGVMGFAQLLLEEPGFTPQQRQDLETINTLTQRCRTIIQNLLQFSRRTAPKSEPLNLSPLLQTVLNLVEYDFSSSGVTIERDIPASLPFVFGDPSQLQQVFLNLVTNARQAMEGRPQSRLRVVAGHANQHVFILFEDNGPGIPEAIRGKVFDPFFTTQPPGKGTGLGLSICYGIVQQHQGSLRVESTPENGARFRVEFPIYEFVEC